MTTTAADSPLEMTAPAAVRIRGLTVVYPTPVGERPALAGVDLDLPAGSITGVVGESGSGKSTLAYTLLNAVPRPGRIVGGSVEISEVGEVTAMRGEPLRQMRGEDVGYVFQASQNSLNPLRRVGSQLLDLARSHRHPDPRGVLREAKVLAERMGLDPDRALSSYQHELSGGMRQRVGIIFALVLRAKVLILDEPTTALDMLSQASVLKIIREVHDERGLTTLLITHDMGVVGEMADRLVVLYGGRVVEEGPISEVLRGARHPYTQGLIGAIPRIAGDLAAARSLPGTPPDLSFLAEQGCVFRERCALRLPVCETVDPERLVLQDDHSVACHAVAEAESAS